MPGNPYDLIAYPTFPRRQTHPDRLAAVATLFGMKPAPVDRCRVLEIGCGHGGNLVPMAYTLPHSHFVGVDLAADPIAAGTAIIRKLGLDNMQLHAADLRAIDGAWGEFDYILAHGVYSWTPDEVREGLLAVCGARLAPAGVAFISYNALPGGHVRQMLREMMLYRLRQIDEPAARVREARSFLQEVLQTSHWPDAWQAMRDSEVKALIERDDGSLFHDELAPINRRFYLHEFVAAARCHGLDYLGEADPNEMFDFSRGLEGLAGDFLEHVQHLDLLKARRFHQTLLCRAGTPLSREISPQQMRDFLFSSPARPVQGGQIDGLRGIRITVADEASSQVARALGEAYPLPVAYREMIPRVGGEEALSEILFALAISGFADLHVYAYPCERQVNPRPRASRLVREQAARSRLVSNLCHVTVELDERNRRIAQLADGTRSLPEIAAALGDDAASEPVNNSLQWMAAQALLEA